MSTRRSKEPETQRLSWPSKVGSEFLEHPLGNAMLSWKTSSVPDSSYLRETRFLSLTQWFLALSFPAGLPARSAIADLSGNFGCLWVYLCSAYYLDSHSWHNRARSLCSDGCQTVTGKARNGRKGIQDGLVLSPISGSLPDPNY